jgi:hypothetical protein
VSHPGACCVVVVVVVVVGGELPKVLAVKVFVFVSDGLWPDCWAWMGAKVFSGCTGVRWEE